MNKKRILILQFFFYPDISAVSQLLGDLFLAVEKDTDWEFTVLCGSSVSTSEQFKRLPKTLGGIKIIRIPTFNTGKKTFVHRVFNYSLYYIGSFFYLLFSRRYNLVISMTTPPLIGFITSLALIIRKTKYIYYIQDLYPELLFDMGYIRRTWILKKLVIFNKHTVKHASKIITIGSYMNRKLENNYGLDPEKMSIISNWTHSISYQTPPDEGEFTILYSGNLGLAHEFSLLPQIIDHLISLKFIRYHIVGGGKCFGQIQDIFQNKNHQSVVIESYTSREDHGAMVASGHILMIAQKESTVGDILPSKLYAYMASGRPLLLLGPRTSEIGRLIQKHQLGYIVEVEEDIAGLTKYLHILYNNRLEYINICQRAREVYDTEMGFDRSKNSFIKILKSVL